MKTINKTILSIVVVVALIALGGVAVVYSGAYNVAADDPHTRPVYVLLEAARDRSIAARASELKVPENLNDPTRVRQGAGNYNAMCAGCHLAPGAKPTELSQGLYPVPPNLTQETVAAAQAFWVIKHGIKASGMPAWGKSMSDEYIWNMAAFLQELPKLNAEQYQVLVASSEGHSHGGGETGGHSHAEGTPDDHHDQTEEHGDMQSMSTDESQAHSHPPGTPPHQDKASDPHAGTKMDADKSTDENKPHSHPPGTPPHDDAAPAAVKTPTPPTADEHTDDGHQH